MRKLHHTFTSLMCLLFCFTMFVPTLFGAQTQSKPIDQTVYDYANLLTSNEKQNLESKINEIKQTYNMDAYILTINDAQGKTTTAFADDFLFDLGYGRDNKNGILLIIDMDNRNVKISTSGLAISYFTDARSELIIDSFYNQLKSGNYYDVGKTFLKKVTAVMSHPIPKSTADRTTLPKAPLEVEDYLIRGGIAALIALVVSLITYSSICYSYTHPRFTQPVTIPDRSSVNYTDKKDMFVHTHTSRIRIKDDSNKGNGGFGGGSSTHTSSGGGTFGGSGERGF